MDTQPDQPENCAGQDEIPCGLLRRFMVMLYDSLVITALLMLAAALLLPLGSADRVAGKDPLFTLYLLVVWYLYLAWCWQHGGVTVGMRAWKVKLLTEPGLKMNWWRSALRFSASWVSLAAVGMGYFWSLFSARKATWHDLWSRTRLVRL